MRLNADDVRDAVFSRSRMRRRRYTESEVDAFLGLIEVTLRGRGSLSAEDVARVAFSTPPRGQAGYRADDVDAFLGHAEAALADLDTRRSTDS